MMVVKARLQEQITGSYSDAHVQHTVEEDSEEEIDAKSEMTKECDRKWVGSMEDYKEPLPGKPMVVAFYDLGSASGLKKLDEYLLTRSYITGYQASMDDITVHAALQKPPSAELVNVSRWYNHIEALPRISPQLQTTTATTTSNCLVKRLKRRRSLPRNVQLLSRHLQRTKNLVSRLCCWM
ncbi:uncharacterized protein LOC115727009 [Rhodamnia argentea]|uniref:Uncharacterized protein LOC115727009 n=1 Tax=Rhodamnia argentea TaxID=178133 RepID=A0ABM3HAF8_9MYRT|nr:uncharacterized protein LOC115727009 [Rhodamnia argentea]